MELILKSFTLKNATVISFTIDRYCYISIKSLLPYSKIILLFLGIDLSKLKLLMIFNSSVKACLKHKKLKTHFGFIPGDLPARSEWDHHHHLLRFYLVLYSISKKSFTPSSIAKETIFVEQKILKEVVGIQDQIQVCHGGFNITSIFKDSLFFTFTK